TGEGTINNDDSATVSIANANDANETGSVPGKFTVTQSTTSSTDTVVAYSVLISSTASDGGTDYTTLSGSVTILAGDTTADIDVTGIIDDSIVEADETVIVQLNAATGDPQIGVDTGNDTATVTILDNDSATLSISAPSITETDVNQTVSFTVTVDAAVQGGFDVAHSLTLGSAEAGDLTVLTASPISFVGNAGESHIIQVQITGDDVVEDNETFTITLGNVTGTTAEQAADIATGDSAIGTINNDDSASLIIDDVSLAEGDAPGTTAFTFTVSIDPASTGTTSEEDITVVADTNGVTADGGGVDFADVIGQVLTIAAGTTSTTVTVDVTRESLVEFDETFELNLTDAQYNAATDTSRVVIGDAQGIGTIVNDDAAMLSGVVFCDANQNGIQETTEHGVPGVTITLESTDGQGVVRTAITAADGSFQFSNVGPGTYDMTETQPTGFFDLDLDSAPLGTVINDSLSDTVVDIVVDEVAPDQSGFLFSEMIAVDLGDLVNGGDGDGFALLGLTNTEVDLENAEVNGDVGIGPSDFQHGGSHGGSDGSDGGRDRRRRNWRHHGGRHHGSNELGDFEGDNLIDGDVYIDYSSTFDDIDLNDITGDLINTDMSEPVADALAASAQAASLTPTQTFGDINPTSSNPDFTITGNGAINVIEVDDIKLYGGETLTLSGGPNDVFIINVDGKLDMKDDAAIVLDGVPASQVLWNFPADPQQCGHSGGGTDIKADSDAVLYGTILAPDTSVKWEGTINGALIGGGKEIELEGGSCGGSDGGGCGWGGGHGHSDGHSDGDSDGDSDAGGDCNNTATINYVPWAFAKPDEPAAPPAPGISGSVYEDSNGNGLRDATELGIDGVTVELRDATTDVLVASAVTDIDGNYHFADPGDGTFKIVELQPTDMVDGAETVGSNGGTVDNSTDSNEIADIVFGSGDVASGYDFGEVAPGSLSGFVWHDANQDGHVNFGEQAIEDAIVNLTGTDDRGNAVNLSTDTDEQGMYSFDNLRPGQYTLNEVQPAGFDDGLDRVGTLGGVV
ncbi:MAG: hypothetical protein GY708_17020, partial [Actinomycetia bacterium]|nr:hypothetical protein [Actinomycetes bacterium]